MRASEAEDFAIDEACSIGGAAYGSCGRAACAAQYSSPLTRFHSSNLAAVCPAILE
jgi:hypothetical protein